MKTGRKFLYLPRPNVVVEISTLEQLHDASLKLLAERHNAWPRYASITHVPLTGRMEMYEEARKAVAKQDGKKAYDLLVQMSKRTGHEFDAMHVVDEISL